LRVAVVELLGWPPELLGSLAVLDNCAMAVLQEARPAGPWRLDAWGLRPNFAAVGVAG
jgi:hypothetical protein